MSDSATAKIMKSLVYARVAEIPYQIDFSQPIPKIPKLSTLIDLDCKTKHTYDNFHSVGNLAPLRDTILAGISKLGTLALPQAKPRSASFKESFTQPEKTVASILQERTEIDQFFGNLIQKDIPSNIALFTQQYKNQANKTQEIQLALEHQKASLDLITHKSQEYTKHHNGLKPRLVELAQNVLSEIPRDERASANLPEAEQIPKLTGGDRSF